MGYVVGKKVQEKISEGEGSDVLGKQINDLMSRLGNAGKTNIELQNQIDELKREKERKK
jgi:hypothetical protein